MNAPFSPEAEPSRSNDDVAVDNESEIRLRYSAVRARLPAGEAATVIHIGAESTGVATGSDFKPDAALVLRIGSSRTARDYFQHDPPTSVELENAIVTVEDEVARVRAMIAGGSTLFTTDTAIREIALIAGVPEGAEITLTLDATEQAFQRLVALTLGRAPSCEGRPKGAEFAATLLILREFMHHMQFRSITVKA